MPSFTFLAANVRYAIRQLVRERMFTLVTVLTLALGVGANTAIFSVVQAVLLSPAGVDDPARVASFHVRYTGLNLPSIGISAPDLSDAQSLPIVESAAMVEPSSFNATFDGRTQHLRTGMVTWQWFQVFGAEPILGRTFLPEEDQKGANQQVVLSYQLWQQLFGGQPDAVGKSLLLDGKAYRVVGVMRSDFNWPRDEQLWMPLGLANEAFHSPNQRFDEFYNSVVRLRPGVSIAQFNAALEQKRREEISSEGATSFAERAGWAMFAQPWTQDAAGDLRKPLYALFAVVAMILLIACANISGLMLARASTRTRELAIRTALGASLRQIAAQFVTETLLLAGAATLVAIAVGPPLARLLMLAIPHDLATGFVVHGNLRMAVAAAAFGLVTTVLAGLAPVLQVARSYKSLQLSEQGRSSTASLSRQRFRGILVASEIALAFLLVAGAGLFLSSLRQLQQVDPGFRSEGVLTGSVTLNDSNYKEQPIKQAQFIENVTTHLKQQPGVTAAAAVYPLPFGRGVMPSSSFEIENRPSAPNDPGPHSDNRWATPDYLRAMQIPLLNGRWFSDQDRTGHPPVAVIDDVLARTYFPGQNPVGQHIRGGSHNPWTEIVGVINHVRRDSLEADENKGVVYRPMLEGDVSEAAFLVRTTISPDAMRATLTDSVHNADSTEAIYDVHTLDSLVAESLSARRLMVWLLTLFGGLALLLAAIGIYGLLSFTAAQRTTEIGIRMALGAQRWQVVSLVLRQSFVLIGAGIVAGLALTFVAQRILTHAFAAMNTGISLSLFVAALSLVAVATLAAALPANRSAGVDPATALRNE